MLKIDSHQHFWIYNEVRDAWITEEMALLQADYMPEQLQSLLQKHNFQGSVVVQSEQSSTENLFQIENANTYSFIKGIVGWIDLQAEDIDDKLAAFAENTKLKGFRHILQGEQDRALMLKPQFMNGISKLNQFGYTYDILIFPDQLAYAAEMVGKFPDQSFVLDHMAKPYIKKGEIEQWKKDVQYLAQYPNVYCKISGMFTEADWKNWKVEQFKPYLDAVFEAFGAERLMYGSDWPVCLLAASYQQGLQLTEDYVSSFTIREQELFWGGNAIKFYNL